MPAYVVITKTRTRNRSQLDIYAKQAQAFMADHPATYLARFGSCEVKEGAAVEPPKPAAETFDMRSEGLPAKFVFPWRIRRQR